MDKEQKEGDLTVRHALGDTVYKPNMQRAGLVEAVKIIRIQIEPGGVYYQTDEHDTDGKQSWQFRHSSGYYDTPKDAILYLQGVHQGILKNGREMVSRAEESLAKIEAQLEREAIHESSA